MGELAAGIHGERDRSPKSDSETLGDLVGFDDASDKGDGAAREERGGSNRRLVQRHHSQKKKMRKGKGKFLGSGEALSLQQ